MNAKKVLDANRGKVDEVTFKLVRLIRKRNDIVRKITRAKKELGLPMLDVQREKELIKKVREVAKQEGVDPDLIEQITKILMEKSRGLN